MPEKSKNLISEFDKPRDAAPVALICDLELANLDQPQHAALGPLLWQYIRVHRDSNDPAVLIAAGSAIRQYIAALDVDKIGSVTEILITEGRVGVPLEIELETAKMVFRKFSANPPAVRNSEPQLAKELAARAAAYLDEHVLRRGQFAAAAMLAIQAMVTMRSDSINDILPRLHASHFSWFRGQLRRRLEKVVTAWRRRDVPEDAIADVANFINQLKADPVEKLCQPSA